MPKANTYEYGILQEIDAGSAYAFVSNKHVNALDIRDSLYGVLNVLARDNWEPCLYFVEGETSTWIMRRTED